MRNSTYLRKNNLKISIPCTSCVTPVARVDDVDDELDREDDAGHHPEDSNVGPSVAPTEVVSSVCGHSIHPVTQSGGNCADCQVTL